MSIDESNWRTTLLNRLRDKNKIETAYDKVIHQNNRLLDAVSQLESEKLKISVENEQLRTALATGGNGKHSGGSNLIATLEKKLLAQQEELTQLHKRKGENSQLIVDLNVKVEKLNNALSEKDKRLSESVAINNSLRAEVQMFNSSMDELKKLDTTLRDEHTALQLAFSSLEEKLRKVQDENHGLLDRLMQYKSKDADKLNEENDSFLRKRSDKMRQDLQDAVRESRNSISPSHLPPSGDFYEDVGIDLINDDLYGGPSSLRLEMNYPSTILSNFEAHDGEVCAVRWSPVDRILATGGADRKVKLWDAEKRSSEPCGILTGSSAGINSVDFDSSGCYIIGTSNDYAARIWTVADHRLRHSLTAHSAKVMAAKYIQEPSKVVTGSHDRTLKIWDLRYGSCIETKFAGSSCNDLVTTDSLGSTIISGHFDKKIRFWDIRTEKYTKDVLMTGKITSLDITKDCNFLLSSGRDDTLKLLDLRMNHIVTTYEHENFKLNCDWARAGLSFNGCRVACGSADGSIFIWNLCGKLETILKGHNPSAVNAVNWSQTNSTLASVGKNRRCIVWVSS